jgi:hypothetical protein
MRQGDHLVRRKRLLVDVKDPERGANLLAQCFNALHHDRELPVQMSLAAIGVTPSTLVGSRQASASACSCKIFFLRSSWLAEPPELVYTFNRHLLEEECDDRALNHSVWNALRAALPAVQSEAPLRVLEIGAGIGTMLERVIETGLFSYAHYTALDLEEGNIASARARLTGWADKQGLNTHWQGDDLELEGDGGRVKSFVVEDLFSFIEHAQDHQNLGFTGRTRISGFAGSAALPRIFQLLYRSESFRCLLLYHQLYGVTSEPGIDPVFDEQVIHLITEQWMSA